MVEVMSVHVQVISGHHTYQCSTFQVSLHCKYMQVSTEIKAFLLNFPIDKLMVMELMELMDD